MDQLENRCFIEKAIFHPELLYSGKIDCIATWKGSNYLIEWKSVETLCKAKLDEFIIQCVAYLDAVNKVHKLSLQNILVIVALPNEPAELFPQKWNEILEYWDSWKSRVDRYRQEENTQNPYISENDRSTIYPNDILSAFKRKDEAFNRKIAFHRTNQNSLERDKTNQHAQSQFSNHQFQGQKKYYTEDSIRLYLQEIAQIRLLKADEEIELARKIADLMELERIYVRLRRSLDREPLDSEWANAVNMTLPAFRYRLHLGLRAKDKMVRSNLRWVVSVAKEYINRGLSFQDLIQEGSLGLIRAAEKFDYEKGYKFSTYATWWIRQAIIRAIEDQSSMIRLPIHLSETVSRIKKAAKLLSCEMGRNPTEEEIANRMSMTIEQLRFVLKSVPLVFSLDAPIGKDNAYLISPTELIEDDACLGDLIQADDEESKEWIAKKLLREDLEAILATLNPREKDVLRLRYGLDDGRMKTLEEIAQIFSVTRERIRQIEAKALRKLRHPNRNCILKQYIR